MSELVDFSIYSPSTVIAQDGRDPAVSWANHVRRAGWNGGGVDCVAPIGTPVHAWADGTVLHQPKNGNAGNVIRLALAHNGGWILDYKHLSSYAVPHGRWVAKGTVIGYSGDTGAPGQPHVHYNLVDPNGIRHNPWDFVSSGSAASGKPTTIEKEPLMEIAYVYPSDRKDSVAYSLDLEDPTKPLARLSGAEYAAGLVIGVRVFGMEPADFQMLLRQRGLFAVDDYNTLRIKAFNDAELGALSRVQRQYAFSWNGFLAVRSAG